MGCKYSLAIDYGAKYIGIALVGHTRGQSDRVLYAGVLVVEPKPLKASVQPRIGSRRVRRSKKTKRRRLRGLAQALDGVPGAETILRFCRRRGYGHNPREDADQEELPLAVSRDEFFAALAEQVDRVVPEPHRDHVIDACRRHLNAERRRTAEPRPARFENRHPGKCQWKGCGRNVPRKRNAVRQQLAQTLFVWLRPVLDESPRKPALKCFVDGQIDRLVGLKRLGRDGDHSRGSRFARQKKAAFDALLARVAEECEEATAEKFAANWKKTYGRQLTEILTKQQGGRLGFCKEHSRAYVDSFLAGKVFPQRTEVAVSDLFGRSQQIVFQRIWRLVSARLLPLTDGRIDRVVVERSAFDVLAGAFRHREAAMKREDLTAQMYWHGPMHGHESRAAMFKAEFDGRCAYCGRRRAVTETEHLMPRSRFPLDSYSNILPACPECNRKKGARSMSQAGMTVDATAFEAYSDYVAKRRPPHLYHTIKKGLLKLMTHQSGTAEAERHLALLANNLATIGKTQKGPRPLARFLADRIGDQTGRPCAAEWISGRHTAVYRRIALPEFDKPADKRAQGIVNHAVDAIIAGCKFPSVTRLENPKWTITPGEIDRWRGQVNKAAPKLDPASNLPNVQPIERLEHFEQELGDGYVRIDLSAFNWNRQRQSGVNLGPFGKTAEGKPLKRKAADKVLSDLLDEKKRDGQIDNIAHAGLRRLLQERRATAPLEFVFWLQESTRAGMAAASLGEHPSDQARYAAVDEFVNTPPTAYLPKPEPKAPKRKAIPETIGVRCINNGMNGKLRVRRRNGTAARPQFYGVHPQYRAIYVGYRAGEDGEPDRGKPIQLHVDQAHAVSVKQPGKPLAPGADDEASPLRGRILGADLTRKQFMAQWNAALAELFGRLEIVKWFRLTQGCFVEKTDGSSFQIRNFDDQRPWMKNGPFKQIRRVRRSPLAT